MYLVEVALTASFFDIMASSGACIFLFIWRANCIECQPQTVRGFLTYKATSEAIASRKSSR